MLGLRRVQPMSIMPWRDDYTRGMFTNGDLQSREPGGSSVFSPFLVSKTGKIFISAPVSGFPISQGTMV